MWQHSIASLAGTLCLFLISAIIATGAIARAQPDPPYARTIAGITDASRDDATYNDFLRMVWVPKGTPVTYIGRQGVNLRSFFTATSFVKPWVTLDQYLSLVGNNYQTGRTRC